jgi:DNA invertase Pin-like site-specific DNA recombinase
VRALRKHAAAEGYEVVAEFTDDRKSAWRRGSRRPGYDAMRQLVESGEADAPLAADLERLLREDEAGAWWLKAYEGGTVRHMKFADQGDLDLKRAEDRRLLKERVAAAVYYSDRLSEKVRRTVDQRVEDGLWTSGRPYGYRIVRADGGEGKTLEPDAAEAKVVRSMYEAALNGHSMKAIARDLNEQLIPTAHGAEQWRATAVRSVLLAPRNAGLRVRRGEVVGKGAWQPIVDNRTFDRVTAILSDDSRLQRTRGDRYLLTGLVFCDCGRQLIARPLGGKRRYVCHDPDRPNGSRTHLGIQAGLVEGYVIREALNRPDPGTVTVSDPAEADPELAAELADVEARIAQAQDDYADGVFDRAGYKRVADRLTKRRDELEAQLAEAAAPRRPTYGWLREWAARGFPEPWEDEAELTNPETAAWIRTVVERVTVKRVGRGTRVPVEKRVKIRWR